MPDTNDSTISNPQSLVDAALSPVPSAPLSPPPPPPLEPLAPPVGDDTPLAFTTPPVTTPPETTIAPASTPPVPPVTMPPILPAPVELPKKKSKMGVVIGGILLLVLALGGGVGGYWYYTTQGKVPDIQCNASNGYCQQINDRQARDGGYAGGGIGPNSDAGKAAAKIAKGETPTPAEQAAYNAKLAAEAKLTADAKQAVIDAKLNDPSNTNIQPPGTYKANSTPDNPSGYFYINAPGVFKGALQRAIAGSIADQNLLMSQYHLNEFVNVLDAINNGRTWVPGGVGCYQADVPGPAQVAANAACAGWHLTTCLSGAGVNGIGCDVATTSTGNDNPPGESPSSPPSAPTMTCTGLTRIPNTTPKLGDKLTFTCAGTVTPSTAGTLSYKFRYSINDGAMIALTNKTTTTAELVIDACGSYSVECQACATISGVKKCSPVWVGATP